MRRVLLALSLLTLPSLAHAQLTDDRATTLGRRYVNWMFSGQADSLVAAMTPEAVQRVGGRDGVLERSNMLQAQVGAEESVVKEEVVRENGTVVYVRRARFSGIPVPLRIRWELNADGKIVRGEMAPDEDQ